MGLPKFISNLFGGGGGSAPAPVPAIPPPAPAAAPPPLPTVPQAPAPPQSFVQGASPGQKQAALSGTSILSGGALGAAASGGQRAQKTLLG